MELPCFALRQRSNGPSEEHYELEAKRVPQVYP
jgi:hypothetical protein